MSIVRGCIIGFQHLTTAQIMSVLVRSVRKRPDLGLFKGSASRNGKAFPTHFYGFTAFVSFLSSSSINARLLRSTQLAPEKPYYGKCIVLVGCSSQCRRTRVRSSTTIEELSRHCRSRPSFAIAYFYFDFQSKDTSLRAVLQSLIKQLSLQCSRIPEVLEKLFTQNANGYQPATLEELTSTIMSIIGDFQEVYVVFDALDECPERDELMILLRKLHDGKLDTLHLLATSRKERDIEDTLKTLVSHEVPMDESLVDGDIRVHVSKILETAIEFRMCSVEEKDKIKTTLIDGAHGM